MIDLRNPDFRINLTTGIIGVGYHLSKNFDLAILVDEGSFSTHSSRGPLGFWILKGKVRDFASEDYLLSQQEKFGRIDTQPFGPDRLLTIDKADLQGLYQFAKEVLGKAKVA